MRLITGGSGYLGIALSRYLVRRGIAVRVFDMKRSPLLPDEIDFFKADIRDRDAVMKSLEGATHAYHLAALLPQRKAQPDVMQAVHIGGTKNILDGCVKHGVNRIVFLSSSEVYGSMAMNPSPETAPIKPHNEYGRNKVECERMCADYADKHGLKICILRPPTLIGEENTDEALLLMLKSVKAGAFFPIIGSGNNRMHALDVMDCAAAVYECGERPEAVGRTFNVGVEYVPTILEVAEAMKKHARTGVKIIRIPAPIGLGILRLLSMLGLSPVMPDHFELLTGDFVMDTSKIKNVLGWVPDRTYVQSSEAMYDWYLQELSSKK